MASKPSPELLKFMETYSVDSDEVWEVHGSTWVVKHKALERVAAEQKIKWDRPALIETNSEKGIVAICVFGTLGERTEWSIGEATPKNNKNQYPYAMAEKRAKDRVILKLLNAHGALYSEAEADDFAQGNGKEKVTTLPKKDSRAIFDKMQGEVRNSQTREQLKSWMIGNADRIKTLPEDWQDILRLQCEEMMADLRNREAA